MIMPSSRETSYNYDYEQVGFNKDTESLLIERRPEPVSKRPPAKADVRENKPV